MKSIFFKSGNYMGLLNKYIAHWDPQEIFNAMSLHW